MTRVRSATFSPRPRNVAEAGFIEEARSRGWQVTDKGFPRFICYKNGDIMLVEVKTTKKRRYRSCEFMLMNTLGRKGIKCYKYAPDRKFWRG